MDFQPEVKQALKQLPPAQRVVAIALKNIYQKIKNLYVKEKEQIEKNRLIYFDKFRAIQQNTGKIIKGKKIDQSQLSNSGQYFVEQQKNDMKAALESAAPIKDYWLIALKNSQLNTSIKQKDIKILEHLQNITTKTNQNNIQLTFIFEKGEEVQAGSYRRIITLEGGTPVSIKGDKLKLKHPTSQGLVHQLFLDVEGDQTYELFEIHSYLISSLVPYSLRFFLGEVDIGDDQEDQEDQQGEQVQQQNGEKAQSQQQAEPKGGRKKKN